MQAITKYLVFLLLSLTITSCKIADLKTDALRNLAIADAEEKGRQLLQLANEKMGYHHLKEVSVYEMTAHFDWSPFWTMMPMNPLPGNKGKDILFRFAADSFDGQAAYLEGRKQGKIYGLQSWQAYQRAGKAAPATDLNSKRYPWGLATYHYLAEAPLRLLTADFIRYAGDTTFNGKQYDLVFVTWGDGTQKKAYDQWLLYINQADGFIDLAELTIMDYFLPMPNGLRNGTVQFPKRQKTAIGTYFPTTVVIQLGRPKENLARDVYTFTLRDFKFDAFDPAILSPLAGLTPYGNRKPAGR